MTARDAFASLAGGPPEFSGVSATNSASVNATSGIALLLSYNTIAFDVGDYHDAGAPSRFVAPVTGKYYVRAGATLGASSNGYRELSVHKGSAGVYNTNNIVLIDIKAPNAASNTTWLNANGIVSLTAGEYLEAFVLHDAGVVLSVSRATYVPFQMMLVGV